MESLAVRYGSSDQIRVLNNLLSERALTAHTSVYVPLPETDADSLAGKHLRRVVTGALSRVLPVRFPPSVPLHVLHFTEISSNLGLRAEGHCCLSPPNLTMTAIRRVLAAGCL